MIVWNMPRISVKLRWRNKGEAEMMSRRDDRGHSDVSCNLFFFFFSSNQILIICLNRTLISIDYFKIILTYK